MPDIKNMEGPVKFKKGVELYFDPKKDMFYDPKKKKYVSEKDILALEEVELTEKISCGCGSDCGHCEGKHSESEVGKECECCGNEIMKEAHCNSKKKKVEEDGDEEYEKFFQSALKKFGVSSPSELKGDKKKEFFDYVDKNWKGDKEEDEEETIEELNIGMSFAGNGLSVYDRDRESSGDYVKIAHVQGKPNKKVKDGDDITLNIYDKKKSNHKAIIAKVEKSFPNSNINIDDRSKMKMTQEEKEKDMEEIEESRIRLSSLMNGGALLYDRDEDPDDDKLATVKVKGNPKKDIKNGDDLVLSLMGKGKSKEKEILKSLKKYYPKSKVVKEETIEEMFDLGDKVKRKDGSEEGEVVQRKTEDKSVGGRYKLKLKNGSRSKWINGNSLELVEQFSKKMEKYVDACGKDFTNWK
jgi:hypothetical protein